MHRGLAARLLGFLNFGAYILNAILNSEARQARSHEGFAKEPRLQPKTSKAKSHEVIELLVSL